MDPKDKTRVSPVNDFLSKNLASISGYVSLVSDFASISNSYNKGALDRIIADHNSTMARYEKGFIDLRTEQSVSILREEEARLLGDSRAIAGASGFSVASKTNQDIERDILVGISKDIAVIRTSGGFDKLKSEIKAQSYEMEGKQSQAAANTKIITALSKLPESTSFLFKKRSA